MFVADEERPWVLADPAEVNIKLLLLWTAKEGLYKLFSPWLTDISFQRHLVVWPHTLVPTDAGWQGRGSIRRPEVQADFQLQWLRHKGFLLALVADPLQLSLPMRFTR
jgi:hypothetical protein